MSDEKPKKIDFKKLFESFKDEDFPPCKFCGRVVLAGWCCTKALEEVRTKKT